MTNCRNERLTSITTPIANPTTASHRGKVPERQMIVDVAKTNTAAARAASTNMYENDAALACSRVSALSGGAPSSRLSATRLASWATPDQYMATNSRPLPRNTVAKKRSSWSPIRSRTTPRNHRNAMPANGAR